MSLPDHWQEIGWNGITLQLPADWAPTVIHKAYLLFERAGQPVFELKWQERGGKFAPEGFLKRFQRSLGRNIPVKTWRVPEDLRQRLHPFNVNGFRFQQSTFFCHILLLFCPDCKRTILLRFYADPADDSETSGRILESLQDHPQQEDHLWAVYDIRGLLPRTADLQSSEFLPGRFTLTFSYAGAIITLYRFKPAAAILNRQRLEDFGVALGGRGEMAVKSSTHVSFTDRAAGLHLLRARIRSRPVWHWFQLWHIEDHNVILGVKGEGRRRQDTPLFEHIRRNFTVTESS